MIRQWYGNGVENTLRGFLLALELLPTRRLRLGPIEPEDVAAWGFWVRGSENDLDQFEQDLADRAVADGIRIASIDVAVRD